MTGVPTSADPDSGVITVSRRTVVQDALFPYVVMVDHRPAGHLWDWRTRRFVVPVGQHVVRLRGRRKGFSSDVVVEVQTGQTVRLRTWSRLRRLPFTWRGVLTFLLNPTGHGYRYPFPFELDPFGLWGNPRPWIVLGERPPSPGPVRFDSSYSDGSKSRALSATEAAIIELVGAVTFKAERNGCNPEDVDHLLRALTIRAQRGDPISVAHITDYELRLAKRGYDRHEVEQLLRRLCQQIEQSE
jgi:hypothetical protein